jgi:hypothetical protein
MNPFAFFLDEVNKSILMYHGCIHNAIYNSL